ncbi:MAG: nucleotidyl transferase AbiEii/AbiGii toxin family protein [Deltaproteobacteria bacterium]|nr:nucleotidyl transferase AbiEii/AbiGii toxin family protein [Deltaproteobacteria bacterium]
MSEERNGRNGTHVVGVVEAFDPGPSVAAAAEALAAGRAPFALIGGLALDAWGIPRATKDADFAVPVGSAEPAAERLRGAETEIRPLRIGGVAVREQGRGLRIDLVDRRIHFGALFLDAIGEATDSGRRARVGGVEVPLVSLEHLLVMKLVSGEPKDDADVRRILQLEILDYRRARDLAERHLGAATANRLDAFGREAGRPEVVRRPYRNGDEPG